MINPLKPTYDAVIIGGGPGGSAAGTYLAKSGRRTLILEKELFPRFHIGESLLPYNRRIFEEMGVLQTLEKADFPRKKGAQFHLGNGRKAIKLIFRNGQFTREPEAFQVERAVFDDLLLKHAASTGAEVRHGWTVTRVKNDSYGATVDATDPLGRKETFEAKFVLDCSGRNNFTGNQEGIRVIHPELKKVAVFGHFTGVQLDAGEKAGDTVIVRLHNKWFWIIPISSSKTSVGCVLDAKELSASGKTPAALFEQIAGSSPVMKSRLKDAKLCGSIQSTGDFSYYNKKLTGPSLLRVGDAAGFMDPIFSAGVYLAMYSGKLAAETVDKALRYPGRTAAFLKRYEARVFRSMRFYWEMVENFYTTPFMEVFLEPREKFRLASAVNAALAGEVEGGFGMAWRMRLFFWLVKQQGRRPFLPRITFD